MLAQGKVRRAPRVWPPPWVTVPLHTKALKGRNHFATPIAGRPAPVCVWRERQRGSPNPRPVYGPSFLDNSPGIPNFSLSLRSKTRRGEERAG